MTRSTQESQRFFSTWVSFQQYGRSLKLKLILLKALIRCTFATTQSSGLFLFLPRYVLGMYKSFNIYHLKYSLINGSSIMLDWIGLDWIGLEEVCNSHKISWLYPKHNRKTKRAQNYINPSSSLYQMCNEWISNSYASGQWYKWRMLVLFGFARGAIGLLTAQRVFASSCRDLSAITAPSIQWPPKKKNDFHFAQVPSGPTLKSTGLAKENPDWIKSLVTQLG